MINMMMPAIPTDLPVTLQTLSDLISLLADPGAAKQRLADMQATIATLQQSADEQKTQIAAFTVAKADHQRTLKAATAEQAAKLAADKAAFDAECARRKSDLDNREAQLTQLQAKAQKDADAAAAARADYEKRVALMKAAAA